ncbi:MAG: S-methyl-5'-thioadenosine phosphorylase [Elusimicrobiota bacterium]
MTVKIGIIGGSGLYDIEGIEHVDEVMVETPFGEPSDKITIGMLNGKNVAFLPRHAKGHKIMPSEINYRANIYALKSLGVQSLISVSAVGSLKEEHKPGDIVFVDQFIDLTKNRKSTFFDNGIAAHVSMADPVCNELQSLLYNTAKDLNLSCKMGGTYVCMEGPQFSSRAESNLYRSWNVDVIGMTNMPEAKLAREVGMCYSTIALVTDYDCWHSEEEDVTVEAILGILHKNSKNAKKLIAEAVRHIENKKECGCSDALRFAIVTSPEAFSEKAKKDLSIII